MKENLSSLQLPVPVLVKAPQGKTQNPQNSTDPALLLLPQRMLMSHAEYAERKKSEKSLHANKTKRWSHRCLRSYHREGSSLMTWVTAANASCCTSARLPLTSTIKTSGSSAVGSSRARNWLWTMLAPM